MSGAAAPPTAHLPVSLSDGRGTRGQHGLGKRWATVGKRFCAHPNPAPDKSPEAGRLISVL